MDGPPTPFYTARRRSLGRYKTSFLTARIAVIDMMIALEHGRVASRYEYGLLCYQRSLCARELRRRGELPAHMDRYGRPEDIRGAST